MKNLRRLGFVVAGSSVLVTLTTALAHAGRSL